MKLDNRLSWQTVPKDQLYCNHLIYFNFVVISLAAFLIRVHRNAEHDG